jgi:benzylsuccinate CoA-transferase BbsE subunit
MYPLGDADRPPVRMSHHGQTYLQAGVEGAAAASLALYHRSMTGEGQHIDLSIQAAMAQNGDAGWDHARLVRPRRLGLFSEARIQVTRTWITKDGGLISWLYMPGNFEGKKRNAGLVKWMSDEGLATEFLNNYDWDDLDYMTVNQDIINQIEEPTRIFFLSHTKSELLAGAVKHRIFFYPQFTTADILTDIQLVDRKFWVELTHPELNTTIRYPGAFAVASETPFRVTRRAPLIGEHNQEVFQTLLRLSPDEIRRMAREKVI